MESSSGPRVDPCGTLELGEKMGYATVRRNTAGTIKEVGGKAYNEW